MALSFLQRGRPSKLVQDLHSGIDAETSSARRTIRIKIYF